MTDKPWDGRFAESTDQSVEAFTASIDIDKRLYRHDIEGSVAHSKMMAKVGLITHDEADQLVKGLFAIKKDIEAGRFTYDQSLEDIHMHIENRLREDIGDVAKKLHTARSRNDQVALDIRMYLRDETHHLIATLKTLRQELITIARSHLDVVLSGYTHLQRAQPVLLSHHLMAYCEMFERDTARFRDALKRINVMPLGSAALAGTTFPIDRAYVAELLDFPLVSENSMDSVSDRDFILEFLSAASICMIHFSRLSEELILWSSAEFGFIEISDAYTTGSSIMPQKKNPDVPEIVRGKTGRVIGALMSTLTLMKSLPLTYNRDMQEDKFPLFDALDTLKACIAIYLKMLPNITFRKTRMAQSAQTGFLNATDMADYLTAKGVPFREAHAIVGQTVAFALIQKKELHELTVAEFHRFSDRIADDIYPYLTTDHMINRRKSHGGTATETVKAAIKAAEERLINETA